MLLGWNVQLLQETPLAPNLQNCTGPLTATTRNQALLACASPYQIDRVTDTLRKLFRLAGFL